MNDADELRAVVRPATLESTDDVRSRARAWTPVQERRGLTRGGPPH